MLELEKFTIEVIDTGKLSVYLDYHSFELAEEKGRRLTNRVSDRMVNIIQWDDSKRKAQCEWCIAPDHPPIVYKASKTLH